MGGVSGYRFHKSVSIRYLIVLLATVLGRQCCKMSRCFAICITSPCTFVCCCCCRSVCYANDAYQMSTARDKVQQVCVFSKLIFVQDTTLRINWRVALTC